MNPRTKIIPKAGAPEIGALSPKDIETLAYIHSNKFITTKLFQAKFHPHQSHVTAWSHLKGLVERGLLLKTQNLPNEDTYYYLSRPALAYLSKTARILVSPEIRSAHINTFEREHDKRVLTMRIQIENEGGLECLTWLSDYEMRCGLKMAWKKALCQGRGWDLAGAKLHRVHDRTPDGCFEATLEGKTYGFVLEYEHTPYNRDKMTAMLLNLDRDFPTAFRLVVSRDKAHAIRMMNGLETFLRGDLQRQAFWAFSFFEKVIHLPFIRVPWVRLDGKYLPFVKDPILSSREPREGTGKGYGMRNQTLKQDLKQLKAKIEGNARVYKEFGCSSTPAPTPTVSVSDDCNSVVGAGISNNQISRGAGVKTKEVEGGLKK